MKLKYLLACAAMGTLLCTSCIKDEALNAEADITKCTLPSDILTDAEIDYAATFDESLNAYPLRVEVTNETDLTQLAPDFELTPGATIEPASGSTHDFTSPVRYTVTSEDGKWHRTYAVIIQHPSYDYIPTVYHFENVRRVNNYHVFYEEANGVTLTWASGNPGFALTGNGSNPEDFPTTLGRGIGRSGSNCLQLITRSTGSLGELVNMPIASGNLFIGSFSLTDALSDALSATKFGTTFYYQPTRLTGYYKYKAGDQFYENGNYTDRKDQFNIYALFYEKTTDVKMLDGYIATNNYEHDNMVAVAVIDNPQETDEWTRFEIDFDYDRYGKTVDLQKLANGQYNISIILASSKNGDTFQGAPGSTLLVDDMELEYK